jgi:hypothetical protein
MPKIKNMGTATMRFNEGVIISGSSAEGSGYSDHSLVVSGNIKISEGADLIFQKSESESSFIQFKNANDGTSYNAYFAYQQAEHLYISAGRGADFYLQQRTNVGSDGYTFPVRVFDNGKVKFEKGQTDSNASATDLPSDTVFLISGSEDNQNNIVLGGNVVISGSLFTKQKHVQSIKYNSTNTNQQYVRFDAAGSNNSPGVNNKFVAPASGKLISVTIRSTTAANGTNIAFHRGSDGDANLNTTAIETIGVDISSADTSFKAVFSNIADFGAGDILGISVNPSSTPNDVNLTCVWEFNFVD